MKFRQNSSLGKMQPKEKTKQLRIVAKKISIKVFETTYITANGEIGQESVNSPRRPYFTNRQELKIL